MNDLLIFGTTMEGVYEIKKYLTSKMKNLNKVDASLGIKLRNHSGGNALCRSYYIEEMLSKYKNLGIKEANTTYVNSRKLSDNPRRPVGQ